MSTESPLPDSFADAPTSVRVGWRNYTIRYMDDRKSGTVDFYGKADHQMNQLTLTRTHGSRVAASTLLHEILHCVFRQWALPAEMDEEKIVEATQHGLSTVWRDNPDVLAWIGRHLVSGDD